MQRMETRSPVYTKPIGSTAAKKKTGIPQQNRTSFEGNTPRRILTTVPKHDLFHDDELGKKIAALAQQHKALKANRNPVDKEAERKRINTQIEDLQEQLEKLGGSSQSEKTQDSAMWSAMKDLIGVVAYQGWVAMGLEHPMVTAAQRLQLAISLTGALKSVTKAFGLDTKLAVIEEALNRMNFPEDYEEEEK